jgi:hypothetical protein
MSFVGKPNVSPTKSPKDAAQVNNFALPLVETESQENRAKKEEKKPIEADNRTKESEGNAATADATRAAPVKPKNDHPSASELKMMSDAPSENAKKIQEGKCRNNRSWRKNFQTHE